jgi:hypothetical protein
MPTAPNPVICFWVEYKKEAPSHRSGDSLGFGTGYDHPRGCTRPSVNLIFQNEDCRCRRAALELLWSKLIRSLSTQRERPMATPSLMEATGVVTSLRCYRMKSTSRDWITASIARIVASRMRSGQLCTRDSVAQAPADWFPRSLHAWAAFVCLCSIPVSISMAEKPQASPFHPHDLHKTWYILALIWFSDK